MREGRQLGALNTASWLAAYGALVLLAEHAGWTFWYMLGTDMPDPVICRRTPGSTPSWPRRYNRHSRGPKSVRVFGFGGSHPLVQGYVDEHTSEVWLVNAPGQATPLPDLPLGPMSPPMSVADSHRTRLLTPDSVCLYANSGFQRVASAPAGGGFYAVAGGCS